MSVGRPWNVKFKETSVSVVKALFTAVATVVKGVFSAFLGGFSK